MPELLLTLHCASDDAEALAEALRPIISAPLHVRAGTVRAHDFSGAGTAELVAGERRRTTIEMVVNATDMPAMLRQINDTRRRQPVEWRTVILDGHGRIS